jgi:FO synthase
MTPEEVLEIVLKGQEAGCTEALITLGDSPESKYSAAADELERLGFHSTIDYLAHLCGMIMQCTNLLPHVNAGVVTAEQLAMLRRVSASQGLMLETTAHAVHTAGGAHYNCPDKVPARRIKVLRDAGTLCDHLTFAFFRLKYARTMEADLVRWRFSSQYKSKLFLL